MSKDDRTGKFYVCAACRLVQRRRRSRPSQVLDCHTCGGPLGRLPTRKEALAIEAGAPAPSPTVFIPFLECLPPHSEKTTSGGGENKMPIYIGLSGAKGAGKDTVASAISRALTKQGKWPVTAPLAGTLKAALTTITGISAERFNDPATKELPIPGWELTPRELMQRFGTEIGKQLHPDLWLRKLVAETHNMANGIILVPDIRFPEEHRWLKDLGGFHLHVSRPSVESSGDAHASEAHVQTLRASADAVFENTGSLEDVGQFASLFVRSDAFRQIQPADWEGAAARWSIYRGPSYWPTPK